jgi:CRP-like cAMP-binding protein
VTSDPLTELLASARLVEGLPVGAPDVLARCGRLATFDVGGLLLREGEPAETLHLILEGRVGIEVHRPGHGSRQLETIGPGQLVGLSWLSPPARCAFDARALEPVTSVAIDVAKLRVELERDPALGSALYERILSELVSRLQTTRIRLLDLYGHDQR